MVVVATAPTLTQADIMSAALASEGIEPMIVDENATNLLSHFNIAVNPGGIRIAFPPTMLRTPPEYSRARTGGGEA